MNEILAKLHALREDLEKVPKTVELLRELRMSVDRLLTSRNRWRALAYFELGGILSLLAREAFR